MSSILKTLETVAGFGKNADGSYTRPCYSEAYFQSVEAARQEMAVLGMQTTVDAAGNLHGRLPGSDPSAGRILIGSHLDTVLGGGLFDGAYGVCGALEALRTAQENQVKFRHTIDLYGFNAEESNPLGGTFGSRAATGLVDTAQPGFSEAIAAYGHTAQEILDCREDFSDAKCYVELHIEQGDFLFDRGIPIGVVNGIVGIVRYRVTALGHSNHAGTTMMKNRSDAMTAMARLIVESDQICREIDDTLVLTVGTIECHPGSENVIPGKVTCTFEMRHMDSRKTDGLITAIRAAAKRISQVEFEIVKTVDKGSVACDSHLMDTIQKAAAECSVNAVVMPSGAGHDANPMAHRMPVGMIFVPSRDGLSHCREEWTEAADLENGIRVLYQTLLLLDCEKS